MNDRAQTIAIVAGILKAADKIAVEITEQQAPADSLAVEECVELATYIVDEAMATVALEGVERPAVEPSP